MPEVKKAATFNFCQTARASSITTTILVSKFILLPGMLYPLNSYAPLKNTNAYSPSSNIVRNLVVTKHSSGALETPMKKATFTKGRSVMRVGLVRSALISGWPGRGGSR
jgi:hypothetical protein